MNIDGELIRTDDGAFAGWIASLTFDVDVSLISNPYKKKDSHPDFQLVARTPRGRAIRIGSAWTHTTKADKEYLSMKINVDRHVISANAFRNEKSDTYTIKEWKD